MYRTILQLQIDDYINSINIKQLGGKWLLAAREIFDQIVACMFYPKILIPEK